ncbi:hypothetical protein NQD34_013033 [Periophthalmus magnuspinnatus]|nr:hypothetical protein NQD34_013033 [Periophthalmus magnuspinnatus]
MSLNIFELLKRQYLLSHCHKTVQDVPTSTQMDLSPTLSQTLSNFIFISCHYTVPYHWSYNSIFTAEISTCLNLSTSWQICGDVSELTASRSLYLSSLAPRAAAVCVLALPRHSFSTVNASKQSQGNTKGQNEIVGAESGSPVREFKKSLICTVEIEEYKTEIESTDWNGAPCDISICTVCDLKVLIFTFLKT